MYQTTAHWCSHHPSRACRHLSSAWHLLSMQVVSCGCATVHWCLRRRRRRRRCRRRSRQYPLLRYQSLSLQTAAPASQMREQRTAARRKVQGQAVPALQTCWRTALQRSALAPPQMLLRMTATVLLLGSAALRRLPPLLLALQAAPMQATPVLQMTMALRQLLVAMSPRRLHWKQSRAQEPRQQLRRLNSILRRRCGPGSHQCCCAWVCR